MKNYRVIMFMVAIVLCGLVPFLLGAMQITDDGEIWQFCIFISCIIAFLLGFGLGINKDRDKFIKCILIMANLVMICFVAMILFENKIIIYSILIIFLWQMAIVIINYFLGKSFSKKE